MTHALMSRLVSADTLLDVRERTRDVAHLFGLPPLQTTRLVTATAEIAHNTVKFAKEGQAVFGFEPGSAQHLPPHVVVSISDRGPGIADLNSLLAGQTGHRDPPPQGLMYARRLVDACDIQSEVGQGTTVALKMATARKADELDPSALQQMAEQLMRRAPSTPQQEVQLQDRALMTTLEELRLRQSELERAELRKNHFIAALAHELRTPLGTLQMSIDLLGLKRDLTREDLMHRLDVMARQTSQMARLITDLMDVSRVNRGALALSMAPIELNALLAQACDLCAAAIQGRQHTLVREPQVQALWCIGDADRLRQVFTHLLQNAARYTPMGGRLRVRTSSTPTHAEIELSDNGVGISPELMPHLFDLFAQGHPGAVAGHSGLGIGLTLVRRLVEEHRGTVSVDSAGAGLGSRFTVWLPLSHGHAG